MSHKAVTSMYIWLGVVPFLANALAKVSDEADLTVFGHRFHLVLKLPFSWECFFFSALFFSLGTALYVVFCPRVIKEFDDFGQYYRSGRSQDELIPYGDNIGVPQQAYFHPHGTEEERRRVSFWQLYRMALDHHPRWRLACGICFAFGGSLLLVVLSMNLWWVIKHVVLQH